MSVPRTHDELDELLAALPAVALEGPKGMGKTASAARRAATIFQLDAHTHRELAEAHATRLLEADPPMLLDEWQHVPAVWDAVRRALDRDPTPNRYLLAGSMAPTEAPTHSGAGRIVTLRSGFPGIRHLRGRALRAQLDGYLTRVVDRDFMEQGHPVRKPQSLRRWMAAYAAATSTTTTLEKIRNAPTSGEGEVLSKNTVIAYREVLTRLWIIEPVPGWLPSRSHLARLTQSPKHQLADPALAARLLGISEEAWLSGDEPSSAVPRDGSFLGQLFESLVTLSIRAYAQAAEANVRHLRTYDGRQEIDLIVERPDQRVVAVEMKLSSSVTDDDVAHLAWLQQKLRSDLLDSVVVTAGPHAYRRKDGIAVVPAALIGP